MFLFEAKRIIVVLFGAILNAISLNFFLISANVYASGFTGVSQLLSSVFQDFFNIQGISTGIILFILNIPVAILGWYKVGKGFTIYSFISVIFMTIFLELLPILQLSKDIILNAVFGGVIGGVGVGITLKWGASTGGLDIVAMVLSRMKDKPIGNYFLILNSLIIIFAGVLYEPENALYTLLTLYVSTRVIDAIHTRHEKVTAMIITTKADQLQQAIHNKMVRGITIIPARGAYTKQHKDMMILVITRYELYDLEKIIKDVDPEAFTNIVQTTGIFGFFRKND
ncbi:YitT family protein [Aquibacillus sp. 3ASR75-11]|uniref:YitT family protein n=1 Tax=Terrihalobacillus insolitus TaxID=2950438 RepID=A0A9X3WTB7_9BACI|nr:YitT family protein [Terrihalobacillus insolitus]MDC3413718.1 YitT family protein [Terrihalobacillus insolitus]MDC3425577.1 YitT family protein [Terrihalobacillus insolitus]